MPNLMVLNPRRRRRKLSAKQIAAGFGGKRRRRGGRARRSRSRVVVVSANPKRRRRSRHRVRALARVMRRRYRRNPIGLNGFVSNTLAPAAFGAVGGIAVDYLGNMLAPYIPASLNTPTLAPVTKIGLSLLAGWGASLVAGSKRGAEVAAGGIIIALYNFANQQLAGSGMLNYSPGLAYSPAAGNTGMNRYVAGMGFVRRQRLGAAFGPGPFGPSFGAHPLSVRSQLGGPYAATKFRMMRNGAAGGRLGYVAPAPQIRGTLGRYMTR